MVEGNISQEFRLKNINETINCFTEKIKKNEWWVKSARMFVWL